MNQGNTKYIFILLIVLSIGIIGFVIYIYFQNNKIAQRNEEENTVSPTVSPANVISLPIIKVPISPTTGNQDWKSATWPTFTLSYPPGCDITNIENYNQVIRCTIEATTFTVIPQAAGRGVEVISKSEITLNGVTWQKTFFKTGPEENDRGATYYVTFDNTGYMIEVDYEHYNPTLEQFAEHIISTFKRT